MSTTFAEYCGSLLSDYPFHPVQHSGLIALFKFIDAPIKVSDIVIFYYSFQILTSFSIHKFHLPFT
jgi:hypothetical protein